ncbi:Ferric uptake regulation protein [Methylocella tundrae]|jgi:Fur family iron response transcriptional regulator|nr:Ferric uptake regulation protein [Methylocella tundrae]VTZ50485.1 Ferric uptake regulation protein [Methylocella tundrae]
MIGFFPPMVKTSSRSRRGENPAKPPLGELAGCPFHDLRMKLTTAGLRPTRQRISLGWLLFSKGFRHLTAENLQDEAQASKVSISLATIYNSLHQFTDAGLLREIAVDGTRTFFDTNTARHHHFLLDGVLIDIPEVAVDLSHLPLPPTGKRIAEIEVVVRLRDAPAP